MVAAAAAGQAVMVPPLLLTEPPRADAGWRSWVPQGHALPEADWRWRHRVVCTVLALHLPVVLALGAFGSHTLAGSALEVVPLALLLVAALAPLSRRVRSLAASLGLLSCSAVLVHVFDGAAEWHFHYFVAVALIALYQEWSVYAVAIGFVLLQHGVLGALAPGDVLERDAAAWTLAGMHAGSVLALCAVMVVFWRASERARHSEDRLRAALSEGADSLEARLHEAEQRLAEAEQRLREAEDVRQDLVGTVSHEFRTPLTGIRGAALTLLKRGDRLEAAARNQLLHAVLEQQQRLSRLLENMLVAARATSPDPGAVAEIDAVAAEVAMLAAGRRGSSAVQVIVDPATVARIDRQALHQVLANLVDNAQQHGAPGAVPIVAGGRDAGGVWLTVSNEGSVDVAAADVLFRAFSQGDSSSTRVQQGAGVGLYVVSRLVEVHGGQLSVRSEDNWVTVEVRLLAADEELAPALTA
jgi:signal transduction histidine kinase